MGSATAQPVWMSPARSAFSSCPRVGLPPDGPTPPCTSVVSIAMQPDGVVTRTSGYGGVIASILECLYRAVASIRRTCSAEISSFEIAICLDRELYSHGGEALRDRVTKMVNPRDTDRDPRP